MERRFRSAIIMGKSKEMGYRVCGILFWVMGQEENMKENHLLAEMPVSKAFFRLTFPAVAAHRKRLFLWEKAIRNRQKRSWEAVCGC